MITGCAFAVKRIAPIASGRDSEQTTSNDDFNAVKKHTPVSRRKKPTVPNPT